MAFKIYTRTGDTGETALFGGRRVSKSHLRVDAYGTIDEANAFIGLLRDHVREEAGRVTLSEVQQRLFSIGALLASDPDKASPPPDLRDTDIQLLESEIDRMETTLPPLRNFILPGGLAPASIAHVCRTVSRRAERLVVALHETDPVDPLVLQYLNRLSDYFFVLARYIVHQAGAREHTWHPRQNT